MTDLLHTGLDTFFFGRRLGHDEDHDRLVIDVDGTEYTATIDEDAYTTIGGTGYADLWAAVVDALEAQVGSWSSDLVDMTANGRTWHEVGRSLMQAGTVWSLDTDASSSGLLEVLGWHPDQGMVASDQENPGDVLEPDQPMGCMWRSPRRSQRKRRNTIVDQEVAGGRGGTVHPTRWGQDLVRTFEYSNLPAATVVEGRADLGAYASVAQVGSGWKNMALYHLWRHGISTYSTIFAVYHDDYDDGVVDWTQFGEREALQSPAASRYADEWELVASRAPRSAEFYDVEFGLRIDTAYAQWGQG